MQNIQVTIRDLPHSIALEDHIRKKAQKLDQFYHRISRCRVIVEQTQKHKHQGKLYHVCIDLTVPRKELVVNRKKNEDLYVTIRDAFNAIERKLETYARKQRGDVKSHEPVHKGMVRRILDGYGFIQGIDGNEYYFSMTNVTYPNFDHIKEGDMVEFLGVVSQEGFQANRIIKVRTI